MSSWEQRRSGGRAWQLAGIGIAVTGMLLLSAKPILIKLAYEEQATAGAVLVLRMLFSLPFNILVLIVALRRRQVLPSWRDVVPAVLIGVLAYYVAYYLDLLGLELITAQLERLILFCYPTVVVITTAVIRRKMPRLQILLALALTYLGLLLLFGRDVQVGGRDTVIGSAFVFAGAVIFAVGIVASRPVIAKLGSLLFTSLAMLAASGAMMVHVALTAGETHLSEMTSSAVWIILWMTIFTTVLPSFLFSEAVARFGPEPASVIFGAGPIVTSVLAVVVLGEPFTWFHLGGIGLAIVGVIFLNLAETRTRADAAPPPDG